MAKEIQRMRRVGREKSAKLVRDGLDGLGQRRST